MKQMQLTQQHLARHPEKLGRFDKVRIRSKEWGAWWRENGCGYTTEITSAGIYEAKDAWSYVSHCGPEKRIVLVAA